MGVRTGKTRKGQPYWPNKGGIIGAIDIGSTKIACLILKPVVTREGAEPRFKVLGFGQQASRGVRAGNVVDINAAEVSIRAAVEQADATLRGAHAADIEQRFTRTVHALRDSQFAMAREALHGAFTKPTHSSKAEGNSARVFNFDPNVQTQFKAAS
jgi:hypothetical protein